MEDDIMSKIPVRRVLRSSTDPTQFHVVYRNLRAKLSKESFDFVRQQRIHCLMEGAWFRNGLPLATAIPRDSVRRPTRPWRFLRLDNGQKRLHYVDSAEKFPVRKGLEDLPERIDISVISEVATGTCAPFPTISTRDQIDVTPGPTSPTMASPLSFSLLSSSGASLADQIVPDQARWADWTDGLNMLRRDGGHVASPETEVFVQALTEIGLKIKLLDLSGEKVEIPSGLVAGPPLLRLIKNQNIIGQSHLPVA
ncbi:hypothetical protein B0H21DRAFT_82133 [Amylocystis lapponica]|nr:hypothetical protein B0H21DRAFT_82133 [Amylocystis lapponica]